MKPREDGAGAAAKLDVAALARGRRDHVIGCTIRYRDTVTSTNDLARAEAARGAAEGTVVLAEEQTAGRGRGDHTWLSARGLGVYLSVILRPPARWLKTPLFGLLGGIAAARAVREVAGLEAMLKWPNDVLVSGRKVGGILAEAFTATGDDAAVVILGLGLNVGHGDADLPAFTPTPPGSLRLEGWTRADRTQLAGGVIRQLGAAYQGLRTGGVASVQDAFHDLWYERGRWVRLIGDSGPGATGRARAVDLENARLMLADDENKAFTVSLHAFLRMQPVEKSEPGGGSRL